MKEDIDANVGSVVVVKTAAPPDSEEAVEFVVRGKLQADTRQAGRYYLDGTSRVKFSARHVLMVIPSKAYGDLPLIVTRG